MQEESLPCIEETLSGKVSRPATSSRKQTVRTHRSSNSKQSARSRPSLQGSQAGLKIETNRNMLSQSMATKQTLATRTARHMFQKNFYNIQHVNDYVLQRHKPLCLKAGSDDPMITAE